MVTEITSGDILNVEQLMHHAKIYAGPGAGKTHFLVENIKNIIMSSPVITQSHARKVLCITYTNAAVGELLDRLEGFTDYVEICTIHGFIIEHVIKPYQEELRNVMKKDFDISVNEKGIISSQTEGIGILHGVDKDEIYEYIRNTSIDAFATDSFQYSKKIMGEVEVDNEKFIESIIKDDCKEVSLKASGRIMKEHIKPIKEYVWSKVRKLTHNEILYFGYRILELNPTALYAIRVKFPFVFVDEFQDTNSLQTLLIKLIGKKSTVVGVVGDIAQSIYSFQGAHPSDFVDFNMDGERSLKEYVIRGNRRSTINIVNFCNFLRKSDSTVVQSSIRSYDSDKQKSEVEAKKIHFLLGNSTVVQKIINDVMQEDGVVITRTWAAAFEYIKNIDAMQAKLLKQIYNSYYNSPIQLRDEIVMHNNVTWVRAFRFIFLLYRSYLTGSFIDVLNALKLYAIIDTNKLTVKVVFQLKRICDNIFCEISDDCLTCDIIEKFNLEIAKSKNEEVQKIFYNTKLHVNISDEYDDENLISNVKNLNWNTSYRLFNEVFSETSKYMTVHQAKGLEWDKVIVSVAPNRFDGISISELYSNPQLTKESKSDEFVRMYYVACSRAKEDIYIHIPEGYNATDIKNVIDSFIEKSKLQINYECIE